jgi:uncharacterized membrane protein
MHWNRWYAAKSYVLSSLWIAPLIAFVLAQVTFRVPYALQLDLGWIPGFVFSEEGMVSAMDICIALNSSFIVFTFGSLLVAIQVASGQLTPRIIATTLLRDNVIRSTVGVFAYGLLIAIGARNRLETVPHFFVSLAAIWGLVSTVVFMFLIDYAARMLRPVSIVWHLGEQALKVIEQVYPASIDKPSSTAPPHPKPGTAKRAVLHRGTSAIVLAVNVKALIAAAQKADGIVELVPRVGDFVAVGDPLFLLHGGATAIDDRLLRGQVAFGPERTIEQDSTFAFRVIVDIAAKALSPAINDPTTAVLTIDQLQRLLRAVGKRHLHDEFVHDQAGRLRMIFRTPNWEDFVHLACHEIRRYGGDNAQIARRMRAMIESLISSLPEHRHPELRSELELLDRTIEKIYEAFPEDLALARVPDTQGLGGASSARTAAE